MVGPFLVLSFIEVLLVAADMVTVEYGRGNTKIIMRAFKESSVYSLQQCRSANKFCYGGFPGITLDRLIKRTRKD